MIAPSGNRIDAISKARPEWPAAIIAGAFQTGVLGVRSLRARDVRAFCFDCDPTQPGFRSVYGPARLCPDPDVDHEAWVRFMIDWSAEFESPPVLISSADKFVTAIGKAAEALRGHFLISPGSGIQAMLADKQQQYALAAAHGMPMPATRFVESVEEVEAFARVATFPCLMKPVQFLEWRRFPEDHPLSDRKVVVANDQRELIRNYELARDVTPAVVLQEVIQGDDSTKRVYLACYDADGRRIANAMLRELRCDPMFFGPATVTAPIDDPEVDSICDDFLKAISYVGICEIEMKRDSRDGRARLIEANPRLSGSGDAAPYAGVDLCWLHYLDMIGQQVEPVSQGPGDFRHVVLGADARAIPAYGRAGLLSWKDVRHSYQAPVHFFDLDRNDPRYSARTLYFALRSFAWGYIRRLFGR